MSHDQQQIITNLLNSESISNDEFTSILVYESNLVEGFCTYDSQLVSQIEEFVKNKSYLKLYSSAIRGGLFSLFSLKETQLGFKIAGVYFELLRRKRIDLDGITDSKVMVSPHVKVDEDVEILISIGKQTLEYLEMNLKGDQFVHRRVGNKIEEYIIEILRTPLQIKKQNIKNWNFLEKLDELLEDNPDLVIEMTIQNEEKLISISNQKFTILNKLIELYEQTKKKQKIHDFRMQDFNYEDKSENSQHLGVDHEVDLGNYIEEHYQFAIEWPTNKITDKIVDNHFLNEESDVADNSKHTFINVGSNLHINSFYRIGHKISMKKRRSK